VSQCTACKRDLVGTMDGGYTCTVCDLQAALSEVTRKGELLCVALGNLMIQRLKLRKVLEQGEQNMTWLCEDSNKYPGTDAGDMARSYREDIRKALAESIPEESDT